jgi:4-oxalocrotonate tautomerase
MPHVIVKLYPGRTEEQKKRLADEIVRDVVDIAKCAEKSVSVAIVEVAADEWTEKVYKPDILQSGAELYRAPGYDPLEGST